MIVSGEKNLQKLEVGKIYKGVKRLINAVWTCEFVPTRDGIFILAYDRKDEEGYDKERQLHQVVLIEDDERTVTRIQISDPKIASFEENKNTDFFKVKNPKHVFSYDNPSYDELKDDPDLVHLRSKYVAKDYGIGESKFLLYESFIKKYEEKMKMEDFKKLPKGSSVMYLGSKYSIENNDGFILSLKNLKTGDTKRVNFSMFNRGGALVEPQ
jgi:hypothetical protein